MTWYEHRGATFQARSPNLGKAVYYAGYLDGRQMGVYLPLAALLATGVAVALAERSPAALQLSPSVPSISFQQTFRWLDFNPDDDLQDVSTAHHGSVPPSTAVGQPVAPGNMAPPSGVTHKSEALPSTTWSLSSRSSQRKLRGAMQLIGPSLDGTASRTPDMIQDPQGARPDPTAQVSTVSRASQMVESLQALPAIPDASGVTTSYSAEPELLRGESSAITLADPPTVPEDERSSDGSNDRNYAGIPFSGAEEGGSSAGTLRAKRVEGGVEFGVRTSVNGRPSGALSLFVPSPDQSRFESVSHEIYVRLGDLIDLVSSKMDARLLEQLSTSVHAQEYVTLNDLRSIGVSVSFDRDDRLVLKASG